MSINEEHFQRQVLGGILGSVIGDALGGMWFGEEQIPVSWWDVTAKHDDIRKLSQRFCNICLECNG